MLYISNSTSKEGCCTGHTVLSPEGGNILHYVPFLAEKNMVHSDTWCTILHVPRRYKFDTLVAFLSTERCCTSHSVLGE
jgi:hypothetical protein